jgi:hypothetical protein
VKKRGKNILENDDNDADLIFEKKENKKSRSPIASEIQEAETESIPIPQISIERAKSNRSKVLI